MFVDTSGTGWIVRDMYTAPEWINLTSPGWRAVYPNQVRNPTGPGTVAWYGITPDGRLHYAGDPSPIDLTTIQEHWPEMESQRFTAVATAAQFFSLPAVCFITTSAQGVCFSQAPQPLPSPTSPRLVKLPELANVHATCLSHQAWACFLSVYGNVRCWTFGESHYAQIKAPIVPPPAAGDPWVEIVCSEVFACARAASGAVRCFPAHRDPSFFSKLPMPQLPGKWTALAAFAPPTVPLMVEGLNLCGINTANELRCFLSGLLPAARVYPNSTYGDAARTWAAVAVSGLQGNTIVCGISSD